MSRFFKFTGIAVAVLAVLLGGLLFYKFDSPGFGKAISEAVFNATGAKLQASAFSLQVARGLSIRDLVVTSETQGGTVVIRMDELVLKHHLGPLLHGEIEVDELVLDGPVIEVTSKPAPSPPPASTPEKGKPAPAPAPPATSAPPPSAAPPANVRQPMRLTLRRFSIRNANVTLRTEGEKQPRAEIKGLSFDLGDLTVDPGASPKFMGLAGNGELSIDSLRSGTHTFTNAKGKMSVAGGKAQLNGVGIGSALGDAVLNEAVFDMTASPFTYRFDARVKADLNSALGLKGSNALGPSTLVVNGKGQGPEPEHLNANGELQIGKGTLPAMKALSLLDRALGTSVVGTPCEATAAKFSFVNERVRLQPFTLTSGKLRLGAGGSIAAAGPISLQLTVAVPRAEVKPERELSQATLDALTDKSGWMSFPVTVSGTLDKPDIAPDMDGIKQAVKQEAKAVARQGAEKAAQDLGGLIRRKTGR